MGNCIGRKSSRRTKHRENDECRLQTTLSTSSLSNGSIVLVSYPLEEVNCRQSLADNDRCTSDEENLSMGFSFIREKLITESIDSSLSNSSFSTFSPPSTSFSSQDHLLLSSSTSSLSFDQSHPSLNSTHFITHSHQTLRSIIDELLQQQSLHLHRQTNTILIEHKQFQCLPLKNYVISKDSYLIAHLTWNLIHTCLNENNPNDLFGFLSRRKPNSLEQILLDRSKSLYLQRTKFYLVRALEHWPEEIRLNYQNRSRLWPLNYEHFFDKTCFIRYKIIETDQIVPCYTYTAIEQQLVHSMSDEQKCFASRLWNYLHGKSEGHLPYRIFKHTLFYFLENSPVSSISKFMDFFVSRLERKSLPHYFNTNINLYTSEIEPICSSIRKICSETKMSSISPLPLRSNDLMKLFYLMEFQSKFVLNFQTSRTLLTHTILQTHESVRKQLEFSYRLELAQLHQYQEENIQLIRDYLPLIREKEPSLVVHTYWALFIQYFNSLFDDVFIS